MKNIFRACYAAVLAYVILSMAAPQPSTSLKTFRETVFTAEQASRGEQVYAAKCSTCHGDNLLGIEMAPALGGATFRKAWETQPLLALANRIKTTMPPTAPNSL
jgi:cytochrome c5